MPDIEIPVQHAKPDLTSGEELVAVAPSWRRPRGKAALTWRALVVGLEVPERAGARVPKHAGVRGDAAVLLLATSGDTQEEGRGAQHKARHKHTDTHKDKTDAGIFFGGEEEEEGEEVMAPDRVQTVSRYRTCLNY